MTSSRARAMCDLIARGVRLELGSPEEAFARISLERERHVQFVSTLAIVNAITQSANGIISAITSSPANQQGGDAVSKAIEALREALLPEEAERKADSAEKAKLRLQKEMSKGPLKVRPMGQGESGKGRSKKKNIRRGG